MDAGARDMVEEIMFGIGGVHGQREIRAPGGIRALVVRRREAL